MEHKRRRQTKGWASEPVVSSQHCKGGRKQKGGNGMTQTCKCERAQGEEFNNTCLGIPLMLRGSNSIMCWLQSQKNETYCD